MPNPLRILDTVGDVIKGSGKTAGKTAGSKTDDVIDAEVIDVVEDSAKAGTKAAGKTAEAAKEAEKKSRLGGIAKGGALAGGVLGVGYIGTQLAGGDDKPELVKPNGGGVAGAVAGAAGAARDAVGMGSGTVEFDPEVLEPFINELNARADDLEAVLASAPDAFAALQAYLRRDTLGSPTRSGAASPIVADMDQALTKTQETFTAAANGVITQLRGDAARLKAILTGHLDNEESNVAAINNIDTTTV